MVLAVELVDTKAVEAVALEAQVHLVQEVLIIVQEELEQSVKDIMADRVSKVHTLITAAQAALAYHLQFQVVR
jgi:hypothetical protein